MHVVHLKPSNAGMTASVHRCMTDGCQVKLQMGLGKTVELLACLLAHPFTPSTQPPPPKPNSGSKKVQYTAQAFHFQGAFRCTRFAVSSTQSLAL